MDEDLLRRAYGAGASDGERADALAELARQRQEALADAPATDAFSEDALSESARRERADEGSDAPPRQSHGDVGHRVRRHGTWSRASSSSTLLVASAVVVGALVGHTAAMFGERASEPITNADDLAVATASATRVFDRPADARDELNDVLRTVNAVDLSTIRALGTRSSERSLGVYGVRTAEGDDVCLLVTSVSGVERACTRDGRFPPTGLQVTAPSTERIELAIVTWRADGSLGVRVSNSADGVAPSALLIERMPQLLSRSRDRASRASAARHRGRSRGR